VEVALHQVRRSRRDFVGDGGSVVSSSHDAGEPQLSHQPLNRAARNPSFLALQLPPELACTVHPEVFGMRLLQFQLERFVTLPPR
jgi:hypothetical protein